MKKNLILYWLIRNGGGTLVRLFGRLDIQGRKHIPAAGPVILASNHTSHVDPPVVAAGCPRYVRFMAKDDLFRVPILGRWFTAIGTFPVKRGAADRAALRQALEVLSFGEVLAMFPEGHRSEDGRLQPGEQGVGLIALRSRAPIVPAAIVGSQSVLPPHSSRLRFGKIAIRFGPPFTLDDLYGQTCREAVVQATERIMAEIARLLPPEYLPLPAESPQGVAARTEEQGN